MLKYLKSFCVSLSCLLFMSLAYAAPTGEEYGTILNLSGKQRMLSQKMSKEVTLIALKVDVTANIINLTNTSALFDKTLTGLRSGDSSLGLPPTTSKRILRQLNKIDKIWVEFYPIVKSITANQTVSQEQLDFIAKNNLPLLKQMNKAVGLYEKDAKKNGLKGSGDLATTINLAGKQRMLTQKMSKEFFLIALNHNTDDNKLNLLDTYSLFDTTLHGLKDGNDTLGLPGTQVPAIRSQLDNVNSLWSGFKPMVVKGTEKSTSSIPQADITAVASNNLPLLKEMNKAVQMFANEAK
ncbi:type IV pili methyl-accepting chemotaxis transducer N-terminal domain-containing protein [Vibrio sp.]|nr:type IV pili methyl-accepting chemotaxis transducer N-terminal domain-containing protein [Vibrio sp.]